MTRETAPKGGSPIPAEGTASQGTALATAERAPGYRELADHALAWAEDATPDDIVAVVEAEKLRRRYASLEPLHRTVDDDDPEADDAVARLAATGVEWSAFWSRERPETDWLIEPLLARGRGHALVAPAKIGKSILLQEVGAAGSTGRACLRQPAGPRLRVLHLDYENGDDDLHDRLCDLGYGPDDDLSNLDYHLFPDLDPLDTPDGGAALVEYAVDGRFDLVVIDAFSRAVIGEENDSTTVRRFFRYSAAPLKAAGITWLRSDNTGKDTSRGARGSSAKDDDVDVVWSLKKRDGAALELHADRRRMLWVPETVVLERQTDPILRHVCATSAWPAGTKALADRLDELDVPADLGRDKVRAILRDHDEKARNDVLAAALRYRRARPPEGDAP